MFSFHYLQRIRSVVERVSFVFLSNPFLECFSQNTNPLGKFRQLKIRDLDDCFQFPLGS